MPIYPKEYEDSIRKEGERFLLHLKHTGFFKLQWDRDILTSKYLEYIDGEGKCFNRVLYHLANYRPSLLHVRRHVLVVFDEATTSDFFNSHIIDENDESSSEGSIDSSSEREEVLPGVRPNANEMSGKLALHAFSVPTHIRVAAELKYVHPNLRHIISQRLRFECYLKKFHTLLHIEELKQEKEMDSYKMKAREPSKQGKYLSFNVPGLAEKRPSLLRGDRLHALSAKKIQSGSGRLVSRFEGFIHAVQQTEIFICFNEEVHNFFIKGMKFDIEFILNRHALKMMHRGIQMVRECERSQDLLFPENSYRPTSPNAENSQLIMYNRDMEANEKQRTAVEKIVSSSSANVYIVFGPPGTGKTVTMVEAIKQTLRADKNYHILACAPSNCACDFLTTKLMGHVDKSHILRMHASSRTGIPDDIKLVSNCNGDDIYFPNHEELRKYCVIICTIITAGRLASRTEGTFNRIFVDEAGQAMEPELMVAIGGNLAKEGKVVLAGDPKQLGPIIRSSLAGTNGLQISYLERLMGMAMYQKDQHGKYDSINVTKLLKNYRSHESIIKIPNDEFYDGELEVCADEMKRNNYCNWSELPKKGFPVIFNAVFGHESQDKDSLSFYNTDEIKVVKKYVESLLQDRRHRIRRAEIGIITPYSKQIKKIRDAIENKDHGSKCEDIKVGSVEEFQGQERRVIILSTVRSNEKYLKHDIKYALGFLSNPKRFNVAVTRAQALLIIIGNPKLLCMDEYWTKLIRYCHDNGSCIGMRWEDVSNVTRLEELPFERGDGDEDADDRVYGDWRRDP